MKNNKKHIFINNEKECRNEKTLVKYKRFLKSPLMQDIRNISEEIYNG